MTANIFRPVVCTAVPLMVNVHIVMHADVSNNPSVKSHSTWDTICVLDCVWCPDHWAVVGCYCQVEPVMKTEYEDVWDWRVENDNKPIWTRTPKDVSETDYNEFFKQTFGEFMDPLAHVHFNVEGTIEFSSILYVPGEWGDLAWDKFDIGHKTQQV